MGDKPAHPLQDQLPEELVNPQNTPSAVAYKIEVVIGVFMLKMVLTRVMLNISIELLSGGL